jgi:hypothetical protein
VGRARADLRRGLTVEGQPDLVRGRVDPERGGHPDVEFDGCADLDEVLVGVEPPGLVVSDLVDERAVVGVPDGNRVVVR